MSDSKGGGGTDLWWFIGFLFVFFMLWIYGGGPQRAEQNGSAHPRGQQINTSTLPPNTPTYSGNGQIIY